MILDSNSALVEDVGARIIDLINDLMIVEGEGMTSEEFLSQIVADRAADVDAPVGESDISTPTEAAPQICTQNAYFTYDDINNLRSDANDALGLELYLSARLNAACGDSASELAAISTGLQGRIDAATTAKEECIAEFFGNFGDEADTLESYT